MGLADYYDRSAIAVSQVVAGFDANAFRILLEGTSVGVSFGDDATDCLQGRAALDLTVRLLARLYPTLDIRPAPGSTACTAQLADELRALATDINPRIAIEVGADTGVAIGAAPAEWAHTIHAGSTAWAGSISTHRPQRLGRTPTVFGAGIAACLAAAAVFRTLLDTTGPAPSDATVTAFGNSPAQPSTRGISGRPTLPGRTVLVGAGAIGQAAAWALARTPMEGRLLVVDPEPVDLGNLQRYVLTVRGNVTGPKAPLAADHINAIGTARGGPFIAAEPFEGDWADALRTHGHDWDAALAALDSATDRRGVQATLPHWLANAWTQTGDLGVSDHDFTGGACLACLYLPTGLRPNKDELVANALGIPEQAPQVRDLLHLGITIPDALIDLIAARLGVDATLIAPYASRGIDALYVEGICGGGVLPLTGGLTQGEMHVPLAHQSAMAGVLLAARLARRAMQLPTPGTEVMRLDLQRDPGPSPVQPAAKDPRELCLCQDETFVKAYRQLWRP